MCIGGRFGLLEKMGGGELRRAKASRALSHLTFCTWAASKGDAAGVRPPSVETSITFWKEYRQLRGERS